MTTPHLPAAEQPEPIETTGDPVPTTGDLGAQKSRNRRLAAILVAASLAVLLVMGGAAFAGYQYFFGGARPVDHLPASIVAYVGLDLKPGLDQQRKLQSLVRKFPHAGTDADNAEQVVDDLLVKLDLEGIDADKDLASWVGVRASAGLWMHDGKGYVLLAVASRDDEAASAGLKRIVGMPRDASVAYVVNDGSALIAIGDARAMDAVKAAEAEAKDAPFGASQRFADARAWLGDDHVGAMWMDLTRLADAYKVLGSVVDEKIPAKVLDSEALKQQGTIVFGVRATDYGVEAHYRTFGAATTQTGTADAIAKIGAQPAGSDAAMLLKLPDLTNDPAVAEALGMAGGGAPETGTPLTGAERKELEALLRRADSLTPAEEERAMELLTRNSQVANPLGDIRPIVEALSGATVVASGSSLRTDPQFTVSAHLAATVDTDLLTTIESLVDATAEGMTVDASGTTITVASGQHSTGGETLAGKAEFQKVVADAPAEVQSVVYVNLSTLLTDAERDDAGPLRAAGLVSGVDNGELVGHVRILIG